MNKNIGRESSVYRVKFRFSDFGFPIILDLYVPLWVFRLTRAYTYEKFKYFLLNEDLDEPK